jgi:hypothetical protein
MSATIALTAAEAEAIARAHGTLDWIRADTFPWPAQGSGEILACADVLREALDDYARLTSVPPREHPATLFPDLGRGQDNALETALDRVTGDIRGCTRDLEALARAAEEAFRAQEEGRPA